MYEWGLLLMSNWCTNQCFRPLSLSQPNLASIRTRYDQCDGMLRMSSLISEFLVYQFDALEHLQEAHDRVRSFQESELFCSMKFDQRSVLERSNGLSKNKGV